MVTICKIIIDMLKRLVVLNWQNNSYIL
jgi:hypothetical protein